MPKPSKKTKIAAFLSIYFYELERLLNSKQSDLLKIKFQSEEANTDEFIKQFLQQFILKHKDIQKTTIKSIQGISSTNKPLKTTSFNQFKIIDVILPERLTSEQKQHIIASKSAIYTNPDLLLKIEGYNQIHYESIEIKSTKNNAISGSSVQQIIPYEWVIFIKRNKSNIVVSTGQYINSITEKLPFPDRSPRPIIAFNTLSKWNEQHRYLDGTVLTLEIDKAKDEKKLKLLNDWQDFLAEEWMTITLATEKKKTEKWFNNALRKFAVKLLEHSKTLKENEIDNLVKQLRKLIN